MDGSPKNLDDIFSSADHFDLAAMGFALAEEEEPEEETAEDDTPQINPLHDMDSLDFYLWMDAEVEKEAARRKAAKAKEASSAEK